MLDQLTQLALLAMIVLMVMGIILSSRRKTKRVTSTVVVIREGRLPGESASDLTCPNCGRKFKHTIVSEEELVKCPYCGNEI